MPYESKAGRKVEYAYMSKPTSCKDAQRREEYIGVVHNHTQSTHSLSSLPEVRKGRMEKVNSLFDFEYIQEYSHVL